jgi:RNA polymerase sigma factor (sigma-70 family)
MDQKSAGSQSAFFIQNLVLRSPNYKEVIVSPLRQEKQTTTKSTKVTNYLSESDPNLWMLIKKGDSIAFEQTYKRHFRVLYQYAMVLTNDKQASLKGLQDSFFQIWSDRQDLKAVESVQFYLMQCLRKEIINNLQEKPDWTRFASSKEKNDNAGLTFEDKIKRPETTEVLSQKIQNAMQKLGTREREVIYFRFVLGFTIEDICKILGLNSQAVVNYIHYAMKAINSSVNH